MKRLLILLAVVLVVGYGGFEARRLISGPEIVILSPVGGTATSSSIITVSGIAENISFLTVNDNPAYTDEQGRFSVALSPPRGYAIFTVKAVDRFGRRTSKEVSISVLAYCPVSQS
jgi:hypothetical protein